MWETTPTAVVAISLLVPYTGLWAQGVVTEDVDYVAASDFEGGKDLLDIYMPEGAEDVPVVLFFHGGALRMGDKTAGRVVAERLVPGGVGVVSAGYRLSPAYRHPTHVQDAAAAAAWVLENIERYGGDPNRVYLSGHSAGAYLATLLALDASHLAEHGVMLGQIRGTIAVSPFLYVEETARDRPKDVWGPNAADWLAASVTPHISEGKGPMLLVYANGDEEWRREQNDRFATAMRAAGNPKVRVAEVSDRDHLTIWSEMAAEDDQVGELIFNFLRENR